jgi:hypothetical protein
MESGSCALWIGEAQKDLLAWQLYIHVVFEIHY